MTVQTLPIRSTTQTLRLLGGVSVCLLTLMATPPAAADRAAAAGPGSTAQAGPREAIEADPLDWLGPLPPGLDDKRADEALAQVIKRARAQLDTEMQGHNDPTTFKCRKPADLGPVPRMEALENFVAGWPGNKENRNVIAAVLAAAREGNWLARSWVLGYLMKMPDNAVHAYRITQLMGWLLNKRVGSVYSLLVEALDEGPGAGRQAAALNNYAALHNSYAAQYKVGIQLLRSANGAQRAAGTRMIACADGALRGFSAALRRAEDLPMLSM